ncbi:hypothetical protein IVB69_10925 [Flavobacterium sp. J49]|uniref:hypothetical protein n=1 Tax=Flavobacterium sp. J49 TaxID=2718534 RepID=UPI001593ABBF|nr:hypothetical protein [Flavobacterium sp. J49]MBF6641994.1 hypothetical protein [Flavobacterium sp. J49]NIC03242.1 hypothetical protein [Flavobacterium sp. J49]
MKFIAGFILVIFVTFLSTPTVVTLIKKSADMSVFYSFAEEEIHKDIKEIKALKQCFDYPFTESELNPDSKIISENLSRHDNVSEEIFSPPPELV